MRGKQHQKSTMRKFIRQNIWLGSGIPSIFRKSIYSKACESYNNKQKMGVIIFNSSHSALVTTSMYDSKHKLNFIDDKHSQKKTKKNRQ